MENKKHHYRAIAKSDHLGVADLEDFIEEKRTMIFTIKEVRQEIGATVAGKKGNFNIAYFVEGIKPLVLNNTNSKVVKVFAGGSPFVEDWKNIPIELYIDETVRMKGELVGGVRIKSVKPGLPFLTTAAAAYPKVVEHIRGGGSIEDVEKKFIVTPEIQKQILADANT